MNTTRKSVIGILNEVYVYKYFGRYIVIIACIQHITFLLDIKSSDQEKIVLFEWKATIPVQVLVMIFL